MTLEPAWPLHPRPADHDSLRQYVERLARAYGVTFGNFCFNALGIPHEDEEARRFTRPTEDVLKRLSVGLGMPMDDLRTFPERRRRYLAEVSAEFNDWIVIPGKREKFEGMFRSSV